MKIWQFIKNPKLIIRHFKLKRLHGKYGRSLSDEEYLKQMYKLCFGKELDLENPKTFNEKLQWLKLHDRNPEYTKLVDKYEVKKYVADIIGEEYIVPTLGVYDSFDEINFDALPNQFVIKCTHDSGSVMICKDKSKLNIKKAKKYFNKRLSYNYYFNSREWPYKNVKPRIIIEKFLKSDSDRLVVYKALNFSGKTQLIQVISNDKTPKETVDYYSVEWEKLLLRQNFNNSTYVMHKPNVLNEMLELSSKLSVAFSFVRTDWYIVDEKLIFSEFTFYSDSGLANFQPEEWDRKLGDLIKLPTDKEI